MPAGYAAIDLYTVDLTLPRPEILSPEESARAARFHFDSDRIRWRHAHSALREILALHTSDPADVLAFIHNEHGKPALRDFPGVHFSLSHSGEYAMVAVSTSAPVGVDLERLRPNVNVAALLERLGETNLPDSEFDLWQRWTAREASTKAAGTPLFVKPGARIRVQSITAPPGYAAAIAVLNEYAVTGETGDMIVTIRGTI